MERRACSFRTFKAEKLLNISPRIAFNILAPRVEPLLVKNFKALDPLDRGDPRLFKIAKKNLAPKKKKFGDKILAIFRSKKGVWGEPGFVVVRRP